MTRDHGPSIKDDETYEALREKGYGKSKAAAIANAQADPERDSAAKGGRTPPYEAWTRKDLHARARELGIDGRSRMDKGGLIAALRGR